MNGKLNCFLSKLSFYNSANKNCTVLLFHSAQPRSVQFWAIILVSPTFFLVTRINYSRKVQVTSPIPPSCISADVISRWVGRWPKGGGEEGFSYFADAFLAKPWSSSFSTSSCRSSLRTTVARSCWWDSFPRLTQSVCELTNWAIPRCANILFGLSLLTVDILDNFFC